MFDIGLQVVCTSVSARVIDSYGRRKLLKAGIAIMVIALTLITTYFALDVDSDNMIIGAMVGVHFSISLP